MTGKETYDDQLALRQLQEWETDIIALPETNKNWNRAWTTEKWRRLVQSVWKHAKVYTATIQPAPQDEHYIQGGVSLIVTNKWASRVIANGTDPLGRWAWIKLAGRRKQTLTCLVMYRPHNGSPIDGKVGAVWTQ